MTEAKIVKQVALYADKVRAETPISQELTDAESGHVISTARLKPIFAKCQEARRRGAPACICATLPGYKELDEAHSVTGEKWSALYKKRSDEIRAKVALFERQLRSKSMLAQNTKTKRRKERVERQRTG